MENFSNIKRLKKGPRKFSRKFKVDLQNSLEKTASYMRPFDTITLHGWMNLKKHPHLEQIIVGTTLYFVTSTKFR